MNSYFCGIDVSKYSFSIALKNHSFFLENKIFPMSKEGFSSLDKLLSPLKNNLLIGMEPTGIYHTNLFYFLQNNSYHTCLVNPYKLKQFFKFITDKPTKTDKKDAKTICQFIEYNKDNPTMFPQQDKYQIRYLVREKESLTKQIAKTKTEIKRILSIVFPEIERYISNFGNGILTILYHFPSAHTIAQIPQPQFINQVQKLLPSKGKKLSITPEQIYELAQNSISQYYPIYEKMLKIKIEILNSLIKQLEHIKTLILEIADKVFKNEIEILTSIPGIGKDSAIHFISEIVDITRFKNYKKLIGFCGLDPIIKQSGNYKAAYKISKRGNRHARRIVYIMASCVIRSCPYFREYYVKKRSEGKSHTQAVIAVSTKLLRTIYALLRENRPFK